MRIIACLSLLLCASLTACVAPTGGESDESTEGEAAEGLVIREETERSLVGSFTFGESVVTFDARLETPIFKTHLVVNGAEFDLERDIVKSTLHMEGYGNTILAADNEVLQKLEKAFDRAGNPSKMREALFKNFALMAAAPKGYTIATKLVVPTVQTLEQEQGYCDYDDGITYLCCQNDPSGTCSKTYEGANGSQPMWRAGGRAINEAGTNNYGGYVSGCATTPTYTHEHEACEWTADSSAEPGLSKYHGRVTWARRCGWSASYCQGRCGAGCPNSYNFYVTKDCLDHDVCSDNHPSASVTSTYGTCGNEFDRAAGDFASGTSDGFASGCGFRMWGDNGR